MRYLVQTTCKAPKEKEQATVDESDSSDSDDDVNKQVGDGDDDEEMEEYDLQTLSSGVKSCWVVSEPGKVRNRRNMLVRSACLMIIFIKLSPSLSW